VKEKKIRYYDRDSGKIVEGVDRAKPKKILLPSGDEVVETQRPPTVRDARKLGFLPSVTSICGQVESYSLGEWKINEAVKAAASIDYTGVTQSELDAYISVVRAKADEYTNEAADIGQAYHAAIDRFFDLGEVPENELFKKAALAIRDYMTESFGGGVGKTEVNRASAACGFAGTPDLEWLCADGSVVIADVKTTDASKLKAPYAKWKLQLGGYDKLTEDERMEGTPVALVQLVVDRKTAELKPFPYDIAEDWKSAFCHQFEYWCIANKYDPRKY